MWGGAGGGRGGLLLACSSAPTLLPRQCCFGYDGTRVQCTERARAAIVSKINVVDLTIRGAAYENRLIKYGAPVWRTRGLPTVA